MPSGLCASVAPHRRSCIALFGYHGHRCCSPVQTLTGYRYHTSGGLPGVLINAVLAMESFAGVPLVSPRQLRACDLPCPLCQMQPPISISCILFGHLADAGRGSPILVMSRTFSGYLC